MEPTLDWVLQLKKLILSSIRERGLPLPVEREVCTKWREGLGEAEAAGFYTPLVCTNWRLSSKKL